MQITQKMLKEYLHYDQESGVFTWIKERSPKRKKGSIAGTKINNENDYLFIGIFGKTYGAHRLAWLYVHGYLPEKHIDHINRVRSDNRISNLREVTASKNNKNKKLRNGSKTGLHGVACYKNGYYSHIGHQRKHIYLGFSKDFFEACCLRKSAELRYGFDENHGR